MDEIDRELHGSFGIYFFALENLLAQFNGLGILCNFFIVKLCNYCTNFDLESKLGFTNPRV